jgi:hypothetical protein
MLSQGARAASEDVVREAELPERDARYAVANGGFVAQAGWIAKFVLMGAHSNESKGAKSRPKIPEMFCTHDTFLMKYSS